MTFVKRCSLALALAVAFALCLAPVVLAGVQNTNHDLTVTRFGLSVAAKKSGACSLCHVPHRAQGAKLWGATVNTTGMGAQWAAEPISPLCWSCHGSGVVPVATAVNVLPFDPNAHAFTIATLTGAPPTYLGDIAALPADAPVGSPATRLKCTSCHDVHSNTARPFLRFVTTATAFNFNAFCTHCHDLRDFVAAGTGNIQAAVGGTNYSNHPADQAIADSGNNSPIVAAINGAFSIIPDTYNNPTEAGYNLGGHRSDGLATGNMGCATCHAVHGDETGVFSSTVNGPSVNNTGGIAFFNTNLLVASSNPVAGNSTDPFCQGCHNYTAQAGPGNTTTYSHPMFRAQASWTVATGTTGGYIWGVAGGTNYLICQTCHDMHRGQPNTSLLHGVIAAPVATSNSNCDECHGGAGQSYSGQDHHPSGIVVTGGPGTGMRTLPVTTQTAATNWATRTPGAAGAAYVFAAGNVMTCSTCHASTIGGRAHNNQGTASNPRGFPGLAGFNGSSEMCEDCHGFNPSVYTATTGITNANYRVAGDMTSHFVGLNAVASYWRTAVWGSGASSKWGTLGGNTIICESCHTLKLARSGVSARRSSNSNFSGTILKSAVRLLVDNAGNDNAVYDSTATWPHTGTLDLCTGCHGPGGAAAAGATHPVVSNMSAAATSTTLARMVVMTGTLPGSVSVIPAGANISKLNCESCHRPHDAAGGSGSFILEGVGTASTKLTFDKGGTNYADEAIFCNMCHNY